MRKGPRVLLTLFISGLFPGISHAHPVSFQGALSLMAWNQPYSTDYWVTYSYHRNAAVVARAMRMTMRDESKMEVYLPQADFLLYRRNARHYQANLYAFGGFGRQEMENDHSGAGLIGFEADAESRFHYFSVMGQALYPGIGPNVYSTTVKAGFAAYPSKFEEVGTWFMVAYQSNPQLSRRHDVTPLVRLMYKNMMTEIGAGFSGDWMLNFMVHY